MDGRDEDLVSAGEKSNRTGWKGKGQCRMIGCARWSSRPCVPSTNPLCLGVWAYPCHLQGRLCNDTATAVRPEDAVLLQYVLW